MRLLVICMVAVAAAGAAVMQVGPGAAAVAAHAPRFTSLKTGSAHLELSPSVRAGALVAVRRLVQLAALAGSNSSLQRTAAVEVVLVMGLIQRHLEVEAADHGALE